MKPETKSFADFFAEAERRQRERIRKAGKHQCVSTLTGTVRRLTGRGDKILKRPVVLARFYECEICGRELKPHRPAIERKQPYKRF